MNDRFRILIVCTGNSCRSPIGESLLIEQLQEKGLDEGVEVKSAGIMALNGLAASSAAKIAVKNRGGSLDEFQSHQLTPEMGEQSHLILVMEQKHREFIEENIPSCSDKIRLLGSSLPPDGPEEIPDPIGGSQALFDQVADLIEEALERLVNRWPSIRERFYEKKKLIIALGTDHRGFSYKATIKDYLISLGYPILDCGTNSDASCDHPVIAIKVGELVAKGEADRGILICGTGHGMLLAANKVPGIRAILPINEEHAHWSRTHNNANISCFGSDFTESNEIKRIMRMWLETEFWGKKYQRRINIISNYERMKRC